MDDRTRTPFLFFVLSLTFCAAGCGVATQPNRFQMSFLPSAPRTDPGVSNLPAAPAVKPNIYLRDMPAFRDDHVVVVKSSLLNTLSHFNVLGAESLSRVFYPGAAP